MKFLHISDLHLGKRVNGFSMLEDQRYILNQILEILTQEKIEAVLIAGDIYDRSIPPVEAIELFDAFISDIAERSIKVAIIAGNHDSAERLSFGNTLMCNSGVYVADAYKGSTLPVEFQDEYGLVYLYMLPFIKPATVKLLFENEDISSYDDAVQVAIDEMEINNQKRNILMAHQFVTGAEQCDSEELSVGGTENISVEWLEEFDYVALGHIHRAQKIKKETIRYSGTPLKYSFSEVSHKKSVTVVELKEKGTVEISQIPLEPLRDLCEIRGRYNDIISKEFYEDRNVEDYIHITLLDEEDILEGFGKLSVVYPNIMKLDYDNIRTKSDSAIHSVEDIKRKSPQELFEEFYILQNNQEMTEEQRELAREIWEEIE